MRISLLKKYFHKSGKVNLETAASREIFYHLRTDMNECMELGIGR